MATNFSPIYTLPMAVPSTAKPTTAYSYRDGYSISPPEDVGSETSASAIPSFGSTNISGSASNYADSTAGEYDSTVSASGIDFQEYMQDRFANAFDPIPLDRAMVVQAQASGQLNAKHRELLELQKKAQDRLSRTRQRFQEGLRDAREVHADLEWTQKKVTALKSKASRKHPKEYAQARARYPSPEYN
jgi:hypothetical protein